MTQVTQFFQFIVLGIVLMGVGYSVGGLVLPSAKNGALVCVSGETGNQLCKNLIRLDR